MAGEKTAPGFIRRAYLELMRNMATVVAYSFAASYLLKNLPVIYGGTAFAAIAGGGLLLLALHGAGCASSLFADSLVARYRLLHGRRWLIMPTVLLVVAAMNFVPVIAAFELPRG